MQSYFGFKKKKNFVSLFLAMGKSSTVNKKKSIRAVKQMMPFQTPEPETRQSPKGFKAKQRSMILAGLKHIGAPMVP